MDKKARDNRANQLNPNNPLYHKSRGHNSGDGSRRPSGNRSGGNPHKGKRGYAIYLVSSRGNGGYFTRFSTEVYKHGFLHLKKEYFTYVEKCREIEGAKIYPTRDAAEFVVSTIRKKEPGYHVSIVPV